MQLPDFLVIGAAKAGTSAFYKYIEQHPQIYASPVKEPHFFGLEGSLEPIRGFSNNQPWVDLSVRKFRDYCDLFKDAPSESRVFEASTSYLYLPQAPRRIKHYLPNVKLIAILRNPIDRAYSSFLYLTRNNREPYANFSRALDAEIERTQNNWDWLYRYKAVGCYSSQLERYFSEFDSQQIKVILYDDFVADSSVILKDTFEFLDVDSSFIPDTSKRINISGVPKNKLAHGLVVEQNLLKSVLKSIFPPTARASLKNLYFSKSLTKPSMSDDIRLNLENFFREDILKTQDLLNRDLSHWFYS